MFGGQSGQLGRFTYQPAYSNNIAAGVGPLANGLAWLFSPGTPGMWLEAAAPVSPYEWQDSKGETPVTVIGQTVGIIQDRRAVKSAELVVNGSGNTTDGWTAGTNTTLSENGGCIQATLAGGADAPWFSQQITTLNAGDVLFITYEIVNDGVSLPASAQIGSNNGTSNLLQTTDYGYGVKTAIVTAPGNVWLWFYPGSGKAVGSYTLVRNISCVKLNGNHLLQATSTTRPTLQQDPATGIYTFRYDGVDDNNAATSFGLNTFTNDMDVFVLLNKASKSGDILASSSAGSPSSYFGEFYPPPAGNVISATVPGNVWTQWVDGVNQPNRWCSDLYTACPFGTWHIVEFHDLDLSTWPGFVVSGYTSGFALAADVNAFIVCPAQTDANRQRVRTYLGNKVGLSL